MSVFSERRERSDLQEEHAQMRPHLSNEQNKELDESSSAASRWLKAGYGAVILMVAALFVALS